MEHLGSFIQTCMNYIQDFISNAISLPLRIIFVITLQNTKKISHKVALMPTELPFLKHLLVQS